MAVDDGRIPQLASECPEKKYLNRYVVGEVVAACAHQPDVWQDLGIELLGQDGNTELDKIKANNPGNVTTCCSSMLTIWRQRQPDASWSQLIAALKQVKLIRIATEIEERLKSPAEQQDMMVCEMMQDLTMTTPNQQQHQPRDQQTKREDNVQTETSKAISPSLEDDDKKSKAVVKFSKGLNIESAFTKMTSKIERILEHENFPTLRRACVQRINSLGSDLPQSLVPKIRNTATLDDMLDMFSESPYWNWFDTRLLETLVSASGSPETEEWLESFKATFYAKKVTEVIPYVSIKPFKESISVVEKFDKDPRDLTISELLEHKFKLEREVLDIDEGESVLNCIRTGCLELTWQIPQELVYRAYTSMKRKHDELSSLAVESLVCEVADEYAGLPILWCGQEVGEVGPIEPLPEHVRQEPYSLPQGFHWVTLNSSDDDDDDEEVVKFVNKNKTKILDVSLFRFFITHPNTRSEWQFGVRTTSGKLVGVVLSYPVCISIGGASITCSLPFITYHLKYNNKRLYYVLIKELMRRVYNINHLVLIMSHDSIIFKPITTMHIWNFNFDHPASSQFPSSPKTPGWRRMTSEDVPSALALINKWSSQFEIRKVFDSEKEFIHYFLCPTVPNLVYTYIVENETNNITDLVSFRKIPEFIMITAVVSTQSPVKQLIIDTLVCAKEIGAKRVLVLQHNIKLDVLSSLSFQPTSDLHNFSLYNYKYHEVPETNVFMNLV